MGIDDLKHDLDYQYLVECAAELAARIEGTLDEKQPANPNRAARIVGGLRAPTAEDLREFGLKRWDDRRAPHCPFIVRASDAGGVLDRLVRDCGCDA